MTVAIEVELLQLRAQKRGPFGVAAAEMRKLMGEHGVGFSLVENAQKGQADEQDAAAKLLAVQVMGTCVTKKFVSIPPTM